MTSAEPVERLILALTAFAHRSEHTIYQYRLEAREFLSHASTPPTQEDVLRYIASRNAQASKQKSFFILKRLFEANEWTWPFPPRSAPRITDQEQIQLPPESIHALVQGVKSDQPRFYLALSTTYGLRRVELGNTTDKNFTKGRLHLRAVKGGTERNHMIPKEIARVVRRPPTRPVSAMRMSQVFVEAAEEAGVEVPRGAGWHSIRRALISMLSLSCPEAVVVRFMGWKSGGGPRIMYTYARPQPQDVDEVVFHHHPFLGYWS